MKYDMLTHQEQHGRRQEVDRRIDEQRERLWGTGTSTLLMREHERRRVVPRMQPHLHHCSRQDEEVPAPGNIHASPRH